MQMISWRNKEKEHAHLKRHLYTVQKESGVGEWGVAVNEKQAQVCMGEGGYAVTDHTSKSYLRTKSLPNGKVMAMGVQNGFARE
jgi:hypothetical protein